MSESLKADLYGLGNINKAFSESSDGDIVFSSHLVPYGIKLSTLLGQDLTELTQTLAEIDAIYQSVLDLELEDVYDVVGGVANFTVPISASTYYGDGSNLTGIGTTFLGLEDTPSTYTGVENYLVRVQGGDLNFVDPTTIQTSTTLLLSISGYLQSQINYNNSLFEYKADITTLASISGQIITTTDDLQDQLDAIQGVSITVLQSISGDLQDQITNLDTITGELTLSAMSGQPSILSVDNSGTIQPYAYAPFIGGKINLNDIDSLYTISDSNIKATSNPVCTMVAPISASTIYGINVFDITSGQFKVEISDIPAISGYTMNWMSLEYN
jgi:hypothetical protein